MEAVFKMNFGGNALKFRLIVLALLVATAHAAIMAIDLGSENLKISIVKQGKIPISIVINEMSKRKTPASIAFVNGDRLLGEEAAALTVRYPDKVFTGFRDMLAVKYDSSAIEKAREESRSPFEIASVPNRTTLGFKTDLGTVLTAEEAVASLFEYAASLAKEAADGTPVLDCVLVVPSYFGPAERQALKDAATLANLNVLSLVNSHAAAALQYGIERDFTNKTQNVIIYDLGASSAEVSLVEYSSYQEVGKAKATSQLEIKDVVWAKNQVGGSALETVLVDLMIKKFSGDATQLLSSKRAISKLKKQAQKAKHVLSANTEVNVSIEDLLPDIDFKATLTREEFETAAESIIKSSVLPLQELIRRNNLTADDIAAVELIGGSSRVPSIKAGLAQALQGRELDSHLDADEAVVLGAGLVAANLSTVFRLRKFGMTDKSMYGITFSIDKDVPIDLLPPMKKIPSKRAIKQTNVTEDAFSVSLTLNKGHGCASQDCPGEEALAEAKISGISKLISKRGYSGRVALHTSIDSSGIFHIGKADAAVEVMEEIKIPKVLDGKNGTDDKNITTSETNSDAEVEKKDDAPEIEYEVKHVKKLVKDVLNSDVVSSLPRMSPDDILASRKVLRELREKERVKRDTAKAKNDLEEYIIGTRSILNDEESKWRKFSTEEERELAMNALMDAEDWLYGDEGETANITTFKSKLRTIRKIGDTVERRMAESDRRAPLVEAATLFVKESMGIVDTWSKTKPWITEEEKTVAKESLNELQSWIDSKVSAQEKTPDHEDPVFTSSELDKKLEESRKAFTRINIKSKPIEKAKKEEKKAEEAKAEEPGNSTLPEDGEPEPVPPTKEEVDPSEDHSEL